MYNKQDNFIGIFDSGIGGLSVLKKCINLMPNENYVFFADSQNFPYGKKSKEELIKIGDNILSYFESINVKEAIIACNTMSTSDLTHFQSAFCNMHIIGTFPDFSHIFKPRLELKNFNYSYDKYNGLVINKKCLKILIIATSATCSSKYVKDMVNNYNKIFNVYLEPADFIVKAVENYDFDTYEFKNNLSDLFKEYSDIDYLVLGCTHFNLIEDKIRNILNDKTVITSGCETTANNAFNFLKDNNLLSNKDKGSVTIIDKSINKNKESIYNKIINNGLTNQYDIVFKNN